MRKKENTCRLRTNVSVSSVLPLYYSSHEMGKHEFTHDRISFHYRDCFIREKRNDQIIMRSDQSIHLLRRLGRILLMLRILSERLLQTPYLKTFSFLLPSFIIGPVNHARQVKIKTTCFTSDL